MFLSQNRRVMMAIEDIRTGENYGWSGRLLLDNSVIVLVRLNSNHVVNYFAKCRLSSIIYNLFS